VSYWLNTEASVTATFRVRRPGPVQPGGTVTQQPGRYRIVIHQAVNEGSGGRLHLRTGDGQTLETEITPTGSWETFQPLDAGEIVLREPGSFSITLTPLQVIPPGIMNISHLELIPLN
jgi:hypothetical protein